MTSLYFFISYQRTKKDDNNEIFFVEPKSENQKPECIYIDENYENQIYYYKRIFKVDKSKGKNKKYYFEFEICDDRYIITFDNKGNSFVYDVGIEMGKKIIDIRRKINQNKIEYHEKMDNFIEALKNNGEENKIDELFKETIELYSKKKGFSFLIPLFLKIYKQKDLYSELIEKFREINKNPKDNEKNMDRKSYMKNYKSEFKTIISEADELIKKNNYNTIEFYGIILCFLNYFDYENFSSIINELFSNKSNDLYQILLIYSAHFKFPINQTLDFFNKFIKYVIKNENYSVLEIALNYIKDIETFLNVIDNNKEDIFNKYIKSDNSQKNDKHIIKLDKNLKFKNIVSLSDRKKSNENHNYSGQSIIINKNENINNIIFENINPNQ
jgi:hypothetical protein